MKNFLPFLALLAWSAVSWGQTGTGVVLLTDASHTFTPTTVDSTSTFEFQLQNTVGIAQTVYFGGLDGSFALADNTPVDVESQGLIDLSISFTPGAVGSFSDTLEVVGSIFGNAELILSGDGIQVQLEWSGFTAEFENTAIGASSYVDIAVTNVGDGVATLAFDESQSNIFSVEFVADTTPVSSGAPNGVEHFPFYLEIIPGPLDQVSGFYGEIYSQSASGYVSASGSDSYYTFDQGTIYGVNSGIEYPIGELVEINLSNSGSTYVYFDTFNCFNDTEIALYDQYGVLAWKSSSFTSPGECSWGLDAFPSISSSPYSPGALQEGETQIARVSFSPIDAGENLGILQISTNSPTLPSASIECSGFAVSEISGELCDATWTLANSPYTLVGDIIVSESCSLTIEPGVEVNMAGYTIDVDGELICSGTADAPITVQGGVIHLGQGAPALIEYLEYEGYGETQEVESPYALVYYNNFESSSGAYDFDCFDSYSNYYVTGTSTSYGSYGCNHFYRNSSSSWSLQENSGDYYLDFYSDNGGDAYLYLDEEMIASDVGIYTASFTYESARYESGCFMTLEVSINGGDWDIIYTSPIDIEDRSEFTRIATGDFFLNDNDIFNIRIYHHNGSGSTSQADEMWTFIDEVRIERKRSVTNEVIWDFSQNDSEFNSLINSYGSYGGENRVQLHGDTLAIYARNTNINFNTTSWSNAPIIVPESGWYYIEVENRLTDASWQTYNYWQYRTNEDASWRYLVENRTQYSSDYPPYLYDWRTETIRSYQYLNAGNRIDFEYYGYHWSTAGQIDWEGTNFRIYQLSEDIGSDTYPIYVDYPAGFESERDLTFSEVNGNSLTAESNLALTNSNIGTIQSGTGATNIAIADSQIEDITLRSGNAEVNNSVITAVSLESQNLVDFMASESELGSVQASGSTANVSLANVVLEGGGNSGIYTSANHSEIELDHTIVRGYGTGIDMLDGGGSSTLLIDNSIISNNSGNGISSDHQAIVNYSTIADNGGTGWSAGSSYNKILRNSIITGNGANITSNSSTSGSYILSEYNYTGLSPQFADDDYHLLSYSPAVDAAMPWHTDAHMPFGIGGLHADMGAYGGPNNAGWGGEAAPSGEVTLSGITDSPQDQGNMVGVAFSASAFDNAVIDDNVTSYAFWRHYDPTGQDIGSLDEGNWELIGEMPAQSFPGYAYQAPTLGNTNAFGTFNSCYTVVAQTDDPDTYWYSNVLCGESVDNLAPVEPELEGLVLETGGVTVFWELPSEEDYAYTEVTSDAGFTAEITSDTLAVDLSAELGGTYTYTAVHFDVNGNASDPASLTLALEPGFDVITLNAGWNLISTDRAVTQGVNEVFAGLEAGNLQYVTGFDNGVQFYDPNGLSFLNTLSSLTPGNGYWVKVAEDDVLEVSGVRLAEDFMPGLAEGWNLVGYAAETPAAPANVFADLEASGDLLYVTGFDEGVVVYDPNGLPFLNTLTEMRNGFGYWVKSAVATYGDVLAPLTGDVLPAEMPTPRYDVVNGVSELGAYAGEFVDVVNGWGVTVARLPILEGGYLMTTALFGDDPATAAVEGLTAGEAVRFAFRGAVANEKVEFSGGMAHRTLALTFGEADAALAVFPNPATEETTIRFGLSQTADVLVVMRDVQGREVMAVTHAGLLAGEHALPLALEELQAGTYTLEVNASGVALGSTRVVVME